MKIRCMHRLTRCLNAVCLLHATLACKGSVMLQIHLVLKYISDTWYTEEYTVQLHNILPRGSKTCQLPLCLVCCVLCYSNIKLFRNVTNHENTEHLSNLILAPDELSCNNHWLKQFNCRLSKNSWILHVYR